MKLFTLGTKGDIKQDDSKQRFLAQHRVAVLEQCCNDLKQWQNNVAILCCTKNCHCENHLV